MANFVLVHGAMHGGWAWRSVAKILEGRGHEVHTPTLTGQGDKKHLLNQSINVETHIQDIQNYLYFEDLYDVYLVLHSYAGILAGPLAERCHKQIKSIVYAGAFYGYTGESLLDIEPPEVAKHYASQVNEFGRGWYLPATTLFLEQWGITDTELQKFIAPRLTNFPFKCQTDKVSYQPEFLKNLRRVYVEHDNPPLNSLHLSLERALRDGFEHLTLHTGHDMMLAAPLETAGILELISVG